jgi:hypothetical protein
METLKDFFNNIIKSGNDRMNSPIIGTYFISFVVYNWRAFLILLFSNTKIEDRITIIDKTYSDANTLLIPVYLTLLYIIILPHIQLLLDFLLGFSQKLSHNISQDRKKLFLRGKVEEASLEREIADSRAGTSEISNLKNQVDLLKEQNDDLLKKSNSDLQNFNNQTTEWNNQQLAAQTTIEILRKDLKSYKESYENLINNPEYMALPKESMDIINNFNYDEQLKMINLSNENFNNANEDVGLIEKALRNGVVFRNSNNNLQLTQFGKIAIKYFKDTILPF